MESKLTVKPSPFQEDMLVIEATVVTTVERSTIGSKRQADELGASLKAKALNQVENLHFSKALHPYASK